ncbi:MAG: TonB-dependent receptor [Pseudomonadota bacterium]
MASFAFAEDDAVIEEIVVTATRLTQPVPLGVTTVVGDSAALASTVALGDAVAGQGGVTLTTAGGTGRAATLNVRGEEGFRTRLLVDGLEQSDVAAPQVLPFVQHVLTGAEVDRIEILAGPQAFLHGGDAGGVVHVVTRRSTDGFGGTLRLEGGERDETHAALRIGGGNDRVSGDISAERFREGGFNASTNDLSDERDGYSNRTLHARGTVRASDALLFTAVVRHTDADTEFDGCGFPSTNDCVERFEQLGGRLGGVFEGERAHHQFSAQTNDIERRNFANDAPSFDTEGQISKIDYAATFSGTALEHAVGVEWRREEDATDAREQRALFVESAYRGAVDLSLGLRFDDNDDFGQYLSVRASTAWQRTLASGRSLRMRGSFGTAFRAPSLFEEAYNRGPFAFGAALDENLREERSRGLDLGVDLEGENFSASFTAFSQSVEDAIGFDLIGFSGYLQSSGRTDSRGFTASARGTAGAFGLAASYQFNDTETPDDQQRIRRPKHSGRVSADWSNDVLRIGATGRFVIDAEDELFGVGRVGLDDYAVFDAFARVRVLPKTMLEVRIVNLFDKNYSELAGFRNAPRTIYGALRYDF